MTDRIMMSERIDFFNYAFTESRELLGVSEGEKADDFDRLIEASWDLGILGVVSTEFVETVNEHGFDTSTEIGSHVLKIAKQMYEQSRQLHNRRNKGE